MKNKKRIVVWSNLLFLIPAMVALYNSLYWYSAVILLATLASIIFHLDPKSNTWRFTDHATADTLIISNFILFYKTSFMNLYFGATIFLAFVALTYYFRTSKKNYYFNHTVWHVLSVVISIISVAEYVK